MEQQPNIWLLTLLLSLVAGYCDTVTYVSAERIFSAHVTGNFIVFAYQILNGADLTAWVKLLTLPVLIISVITAGWKAASIKNRYQLLFIEGVLLIVSGLIPYLFQISHISTGAWLSYVIAMFIVFAIGLQNAFGKLYPDETYAPTTMMTGNVALLSLSIGSLIRAKFNDAVSWQSFKKLVVTIGGFFIGCLLGGLMSTRFGLSAVILPGLAIITWYTKMSRRMIKPVTVV